MMECPLQEHIWQVDHIFTEYPSLYEYICISRALRFMRQVVQFQGQGFENQFVTFKLLE